MQDEDLNDIIKEAADRHHPAYNDKAWDQMLLLLDKHLPEKKGKNRFLILWVLLLLIGGAAGLAIWKFNGSSTTAVAKTSDKKPLMNAVASATLPQEKIANNAEPGDVAKANIDKINKEDKADKTVSSGRSIASENSNNVSQPDQVVRRAPVTGLINTIGNTPTTHSATDAVQSGPTIPGTRKQSRIKNSVAGRKRIQTSNGSADVADADQDNSMVTDTNRFTINATLPSPPLNFNAVTANKKGTDNTKAKKADSLTTEIKTTPITAIATLLASKTKNKQQTKGFAQHFAISVSAGTDLSYVNVGNPGTNTFLYGAGLSYDIGSRFRVRTGFYASSKIYSAGPYQYHPPEYSMYYSDLQKIDADCRVYEIPLNLSYSFAKNKNHNFFTSAGLSSFIMKKESYDYYYKNPAGQTYYHNKTIDNQNKHLFSELAVSIGYQYTPLRWLSLMAEPYLKMPLSGVGYGKIRLNSTGILATVVIKPFAKK